MLLALRIIKHEVFNVPPMLSKVKYSLFRNQARIVLVVES
jgi:hypothetical protein